MAAAAHDPGRSRLLQAHQRCDGPRAGDMTLRETGAIFQRSVRSYDWVGRYGGEEFLLILPGSDLEAARDRAENLRKTLEKAQPAAKATRHFPSRPASA